ncbi:MAG: hypothetical protein C3F12_13485 [Candidatus Methylomirabilota bacterium]|nr:MAG: hypothetical protein C3F12_13485 [candidate division NC10 bacterium]
MNEREQFVRGTQVGALGLIAAGLVGFGLFGKWDWALGLAVGALVSLFSFRLIVLTVVRLTERSTPRSRGQRYWWVRSILRLLGVALIVFLAIVYLPVNLIGMALGLLVVQLGMGGYFIVRSSLPDTNAASQEQK